MDTLIGTGFSAKKDPYQAARDASIQAQQQTSEKAPNIVFVFSSVHFQSKRLLEGIYSIFGQEIKILGCSGSGVITTSGIYKYGITLMAIQSSKIKFTTGLIREINKNNPRESGKDFAQQILKKLRGKTREIAIILSDGLIQNGSEVLLGIKEILGRSFPIIGGSASDNLRFSKTYQYFDKEVLNNALVGTILSSESLCGYGLKHGWQPLGKSHIVTQARGNIIEKIEDRPAVEIYETYFKKSLEEIKFLLSEISILYPLGIYLSDEEEYLLRNPISINSDGSLTCQSDIPVGSQIKLMMGTKESALRAARQAAWEAKYSLKDSRPLAAIVFESVSRVKLLGYRIKEEIDIIKNILGANVPLIGACTFGEQAPLKSLEYHGESHFHNATIAILTIGERHVSIN